MRGERRSDEATERRRGLRRAASLLRQGIVAVLISIILAWLLGRVLTDRYGWSQWLWWMPTPAPLAAAALGCLLALCATPKAARRKRRITSWLAIGSTLLVYLTVIEHRLLRPAPAPTTAANRFHIAHWNITQDSDPIPLMLEQIAALDADLFVLTGAPWGAYQALIKSRADQGLPPPLVLGPLTILTRLPVITQRPIVATPDGIYIMLMEVEALPDLGRPVVIYAIDLPSDPKLPRVALARQVRRLIEMSSPPPPDIVIGDFNITRGSAALEMIFPALTRATALRHAFDDAGHGYGASFPRRLPLWHIDHTLLGERVRAERYDLINQGAGRHRAQTAWIVTR